MAGHDTEHALIKWLPRDKPPVSPDSFIPVAESSGLILPLGEWVLKQACTIVMDLEKYQLPEDFALAVNISVLQFKDESSRAIVRAALAMARAMSLQTIAEGVETESQMNYLAKEGCDMIQGYLFAKPMPYEEFVSYLGRKVKTA
ncbi:MAG: EAL domain-containing protein [Acetobacterium sp.]|nr:EAL domain-containing protein [Acetobacterium sp.]